MLYAHIVFYRDSFLNFSDSKNKDSSNPLTSSFLNQASTIFLENINKNFWIQERNRSIKFTWNLFVTKATNIQNKSKNVKCFGESVNNNSSNIKLVEIVI